MRHVSSLARKLTVLLLIPWGIALSADSAERGRYLVMEIGKCGDCHTPHLKNGAPDQSKLLKGAPLGFKPLVTVPGWAGIAPDITATSPLWKRWGDLALTQLFVTGKTPQGKPAAPPMPAYMLKKDDARAITDYLKSLK